MIFTPNRRWLRVTLRLMALFVIAVAGHWLHGEWRLAGVGFAWGAAMGGAMQSGLRAASQDGGQRRTNRIVGAVVGVVLLLLLLFPALVGLVNAGVSLALARVAEVMLGIAVADLAYTWWCGPMPQPRAASAAEHVPAKVDGPPPRPLQFSLQRMLYFTAWWAAVFGAGVLLAATYSTNPGVARVLLGTLLMTFVAIGPFVAFGSLFGKTLQGAYVGVMTIGALSSLVFFWLIL